MNFDSLGGVPLKPPGSRSSDNTYHSKRASTKSLAPDKIHHISSGALHSGGFFLLLSFVSRCFLQTERSVLIPVFSETYSAVLCVYMEETRKSQVHLEWDEQDLAGFCSEGNKSAAEELYRRYAARLYTLCRRYMGEDEEAKDLMQETLLRALDKISTYRYTGRGSLYGWISRIAVNKAVNQIKRRRWRYVPLDVRFRDSIPDPSEEEMAALPQEKLLSWISALPDMRRAVFNLYCLDGYSHRDIGEMLGISEKASASTLAKARKQLKEEIRKYQKGQDK